MKREQLHKGYEGNFDNVPSGSTQNVDADTRSINSADLQSEKRTSSDKQSERRMSNRKLKQKSPSDSSFDEIPPKLAHLDVHSSSEEEFFECDEEENSRKQSMVTDNEDEIKDVVQGEGHSKESSKKSLDDPDKETDECDNDDDVCEEAGSGDSLDSNNETAFKDSYSHGPEGRLAPFGDSKLIESGEQIYIPVTQEPAPMTEDMLEEHAEILAR